MIQWYKQTKQNWIELTFSIWICTKESTNNNNNNDKIKQSIYENNI